VRRASFASTNTSAPKARLIEEAGFVVESIERFTFGIPPLDPPKPHILGVARRPTSAGARAGGSRTPRASAAA
jgi:hypothetical protein